MKNKTINYQNPFKNTTKQSKQVSQVDFMSLLHSVSYLLTTVRLQRSYSNPLGFYSEETPSPGELLGTPGVSHLHLPSTTAPQGPSLTRDSPSPRHSSRLGKR